MCSWAVGGHRPQHLEMLFCSLRLEGVSLCLEAFASRESRECWKGKSPRLFYLFSPEILRPTHLAPTTVFEVLDLDWRGFMHRHLIDWIVVWRSSGVSLAGEVFCHQHEPLKRFFFFLSIKIWSAVIWFPFRKGWKPLLRLNILTQPIVFSFFFFFQGMDGFIRPMAPSAVEVFFFFVCVCQRQKLCLEGVICWDPINMQCGRNEGIFTWVLRQELVEDLEGKAVKTVLQYLRANQCHGVISIHPSIPYSTNLSQGSCH